MTSDSVHLVGDEHLPPVLKLFADPSYKYSQHKHSTETSNCEVHHTYTIILSKEPLNRPLDLLNLPTPHSDLLSQISSKTYSEKTRQSPIVTTSRPLTEKEKQAKIDSQYVKLKKTADGYEIVPHEFPKKQPEQSCTEVNGYSYLNVPSSSQSSISVKSTRTGEFVTMVRVKFILFHLDSLKRRAQSKFSDEFQSDTPLEDVIMNFYKMFVHQLHGQKFEPRLAYCVGEANKENSKPVMKEDLYKSLDQLASFKTIHQFTIIADNID